MATITGLTAARMQQIIDNEIVDADIIENQLILTKQNGSQINAGSVLAEGNEIVTSAAELAALSPVDGQEIFFVADAANGVIWRFRYRAAASGSFKWEYIGGSPLMSLGALASNVNYDGTSYGNATGTQPSISAPVPGNYLIRFGAENYHSVNGAYMYMGISINGDTPVDQIDTVVISNPAGENSGSSSLCRTIKKTIATAGHVVSAKYKTNVAGGRVRAPWMEITPIRVG